MMTSMKIGKSKWIIISTILLAVIVKNNLFDPFNYYKNQPNIRQYLNRLIEFFEQKTIKDIENKFLNMIDHGLDPSIAFDIIISKVGK